MVKAQFESANSIRPNSPVRIAGVEVGKVKSVEGVEGSNAALLTMELDDSALPLHEDATAKIRPRIFLEGNFFVDLKPGTPGAPMLDSGDTIKISQTASPVQLDEVLTSLQSDSREDLQGAAERPQHGAELRADARGRESSPLRAGRPRPSPSTRARRHPRGRALDGAGARGAARHRAGARRRAADPRHGQHRRRARPLRERAQGPDHEPQPDDGDVRERVDEPARVDPRAARRRWRSANAAFDLARTPRSRRRARSRARSGRACARRRRRSRPRSRGSSRRTRSSARTSSAGSRRSSRPRPRTSRS